MKKTICLFIAAIMCLTVCGCAFGVDDDNDPNDTRTRLKISYYKAGYGDQWLREIGAAFEKDNPDVKVVYDGDKDMEQYVGLRLSNGEKGGDVADIYTVIARSNFVTFARKGYLEDLSDLYEIKTADGVAIKDALLPEALETGKTGGGDTYYGLPWTTTVSGIIYNANIFANNGWKEPETLDGLLQLCEDIKAKKLQQGNTTVAPLVFSGATEQGYFSHLLKSWFRMYEGADSFDEFYKFESAEVYKKPGRLAAYEAAARILGSNNTAPGSDKKDYTAAQRAFIRGEAAMITAGSWLETEMSGFLKGYPDFKMKIMPTPKIGASVNSDGELLDKNGDKVEHINSGSADNFVIPARAKQKELAKKFLVFMTQQSMLDLYTKHTNSPRPYKYETTDWSHLSVFGQSAMDVYQKSVTVSPFSNASIFADGKIHEYMGGNYATEMDQAGDLARALATAKTIFDNDYKIAVERFDAYGA